MKEQVEYHSLMIIFLEEMMTSKEVMLAITEWSSWASQPEVKRYDIALLKIWIQLERFLSDLFLQYATGKTSERGYVPNLILKFISEEQFNAFMREGNRQYIDYLDKIEKLSKHIFEDNPFEILTSDAEIKPAFEQIKAIRNYTAHESVSAKRKYINACFCGDERKYKEPNEYLQLKEETTKTPYFSYYVSIISQIIEWVISDPTKEE